VVIRSGRQIELRRESVRRIRLQWRKLVINKILHADDSPHQIALGVGIATFVALLPLVGFQTLIAVAAAAAARANKAVCVPIVWITNPVTMGPIYGGCMAVGGWLLGRSNSHSRDALLARIRAHEGLAQIVDWSFWRELGGLFVSFGADLWVGCLVLATVFAVLGYFLSRWGVGSYRERRRQRLLRRELFRIQRRSSRLAADKAG